MKNQKTQMKQAIHIYGNQPLQSSGTCKICCRFVFLFFIFHFSFLFSSCMKEDVSDCPQETTLTLYFNYLNEKQENILQQHMETVEVHLFDADLYLYQTIQLDAAAAQATKGTTLRLDAGEYYITAWGNLPQQEADLYIPSVTTFEDHLYYHAAEDISIPGLYYAPRKTTQQTLSSDRTFCRVSVMDKTDNQHTLSFMSAYHVINIYVSGIDNPDIITTINSVSKAYNSYLITDQGTRELSQTVRNITVDEKNYLTSSFRVPHFNLENQIVVSIASEQEGFSDSIQLEEFLRKQQIVPQDGTSLELNLLFEYYNGVFVGVSMPHWDNINTGGGFK